MLYILKILAIVVASLGVTGTLYQEIETRRDLTKYPPIGKMVDIGTHKLHIISSGSQINVNEPTVVLDAGSGCSAIDWALVQPEISKFACVCSYDRAGYGWSEESPTARTSENIVKELHTLLHNAEIPAPYILVGHSFGGINVQLYASMYPEEVAGIVLVDSSHENQLQETPEAILKFTKNLHKAMWIAKAVFAPIGVLRLFQQRLFVSKIKEAARKQKFPDDFLDMRIANLCTKKFIRALYDESAHLEKSMEQIKGTSRSFGDIPLTILVAGNSEELKEAGFDENSCKLMAEMWTRLQHDFETRSTNSKFVIAKNSGHMIPLEQPEIIVDEVRMMLNYIRTN